MLLFLLARSMMAQFHVPLCLLAEGYGTTNSSSSKAFSSEFSSSTHPSSSGDPSSALCTTLLRPGDFSVDCSPAGVPVKLGSGSFSTVSTAHCGVLTDW